jgi:hypothetical protein
MRELEFPAGGFMLEVVSVMAIAANAISIRRANRQGKVFQ